MAQTEIKQDAPVALDTDLLTMQVLPSGVAVLTYDVPGEPVNTLRAATAAALERALLAIEADPAVRAAVLLSGKPDSFIVGADIEMLRAAKTAGAAEAMSREAQAGFARLAGLKKPVVAAIHGPCLGGGFELALACHGRVASDDPRTVVGLPEVQLGLLPGADGLQRVAEIVGVLEALDLGTTGKSVKARKARRLGLVDEVVPASILTQAAVELALSLAERASGGSSGKRRGAPAPRRDRRAAPFSAKGLQALALEKNPIGRSMLFKKARQAAFKKTQGHYPAIDLIIDVLEAWAGKGMEASREVEARAFGQLVVSEAAARLTELFFATSALKKDNGVADPAVKARPVEKIAMLGAGFMGAGIAYISVNAGLQVRLKDRDDEALSRGVKAVGELLGERVERGSLTSIERVKLLSRLTATTDYSGVRGADVVVEAVFEDLALKHRILAEVEAHAGPEAIFASNTSSIPIGKIAAAARRPELVVGMHYFSPVHKMPLLEIIATKQTAPWVVATAVAMGKRQGKTVIVVNDGVGFYTSRILGPYMNEAAYLLADGVPIDEIDQALLRWGWPVGPMALLDEVGIDVAAHVGPIMLEAFGERLTPPPTVTRLVADGRKGRKNERGLYLYGEAARRARKQGPLAFLGGGRGGKGGKVVDPAVYELLGVTPAAGKVPLEEIQMRCTLQFVNEALHCHGEGILRSARDGDVGAVFGLGFPPFRGGPFRYVDAIGADEILRRVRGYEDRFGKRWTPAPALVEAAASGKRFHPLPSGNTLPPRRGARRGARGRAGLAES
jgi:3-hydroxyacyl-CoA dehydrogenase / enoyl-CoA hydratase / 3-hydroxybutyryl-CoA epimerase